MEYKLINWSIDIFVNMNKFILILFCGILFAVVEANTENFKFVHAGCFVDALGKTKLQILYFEGIINDQVINV